MFSEPFFVNVAASSHLESLHRKPSESGFHQYLRTTSSSSFRSQTSSLISPDDLDASITDAQKDGKSGNSPGRKSLRSSRSSKSMTVTEEEEFDVRYKVLLLGDSGVGKTSMINSLTAVGFDPKQRTTVGE